jgi:predicted Zn finger-like uncharacterized protein
VYTQCSKCETVFKLSAEALRAAGGQVRCGRCGEVFNALARLAEDASGFPAGESPLELEARADSILESVVAEQTDAAAPPDPDEFDPSGVEIAHLEILDLGDDRGPDEDGSGDRGHDAEGPDDHGLEDHGPVDPGPETRAASPAADRSLEFSLPPGELDKIFIEFKKRTPHAAPLDPDLPPHPESAPIIREGALPLESASPAESALSFEHARPTDSALPRGFEVSEAVRREMLAGIDQAAQAEGAVRGTERRSAGRLSAERRDAERRDADRRDIERRDMERRDVERRTVGRRDADRRPFALWLCAAIVAALLLLVQIVHFNRESIIAHAPFGGALGALYAAIGRGIAAPPNLSAYQLRQWGVTGDPGANGTLRVRASILNAAAEPEPYPLLRVTLANRFGNRIGARDFEPAEYLGVRAAPLLRSGERVDATLEILDPGKDAEGFEIDVCLRRSDQKIACAGDAAAQTRK